MKTIKNFLLWLFKWISNIFSQEEKSLRFYSKKPRYTCGRFEWRSSYINFPDSASFVFTFNEIFRENIYKFVTNKKSPVKIDCGANIGLSVIYFKELYPESKITAFEPEKNIFEYLKFNVSQLKIEDVVLVPKALWRENGTILFNNEGSDGNKIATLYENSISESSYAVETVKLSNFINDEVDFLKIDIEGAEIEVLKEIESKLGLVRKIFIEYHSFESAVQELDVLLLILTRNNFRYYIESPNKLRKIPFVDKTSFLGMDVLINIYAENKSMPQEF